MIFIIDVNVVISALIKNGKNRELLIDSPFTLYSPETLMTSLRKYEALIIEKSGLSKEEFEELLSLLIENITIMERAAYQEFMQEADKILGTVDKEDVPYIALALSRANDGIWSDDNHFQKQRKVKIWKTVDIMKWADQFASSS